jgi:hypothetical protein
MGTRTYSRRGSNGERVLTAEGRRRAGLQAIDILGNPVAGQTPASQTDAQETLDNLTNMRAVDIKKLNPNDLPSPLKEIVGEIVQSREGMTPEQAWNLLYDSNLSHIVNAKAEARASNVSRNKALNEIDQAWASTGRTDDLGDAYFRIIRDLDTALETAQTYGEIVARRGRPVRGNRRTPEFAAAMDKVYETVQRINPNTPVNKEQIDRLLTDYRTMLFKQTESSKFLSTTAPAYEASARNEPQKELYRWYGFNRMRWDEELGTNTFQQRLAELLTAQVKGA